MLECLLDVQACRLVQAGRQAGQACVQRACSVRAACEAARTLNACNACSTRARPPRPSMHACALCPPTLRACHVHELAGDCPCARVRQPGVSVNGVQQRPAHPRGACLAPVRAVRPEPHPATCPRARQWSPAASAAPCCRLRSTAARPPPHSHRSPRRLRRPLQQQQRQRASGPWPSWAAFYRTHENKTASNSNAKFPITTNTTHTAANKLATGKTASLQSMPPLLTHSQLESQVEPESLPQDAHICIHAQYSQNKPSP